MAALALLALLAQAPQITIYRDTWGVPTITAETLDNLCYGLGYMQVIDNAERMALNYKIARGRGAEVLGRNQLLADGFLRGLEMEEKAASAKISPTGELVVRSFLAGANRALADKKDEPAWIEAFTRTDVLALAQFVNCAFPLLDLASALLPGVGSNQFAIAPKRSATGHPILSMDPHLEWNGADGGIVWYEVGLKGGGIDFRGVTIPGVPFAAMGHTDKIAWSMTNNNPALTVRYSVVTDPNNKSHYNYHGEWKEFRTKPVVLRFRDGNELKEQTQTVRLTEWGPMLPFHQEAGFVEPIGNFNGFDQSLAMLRAKNVKEFRAALGNRGLSMWNFVFADTEGNIAYQYNATLRKRDPIYEWRSVVPGDTPKTKLGDLLSLDELPNTMNPSSGLLINANSAPWLTPLGPGIDDAWPNYITSYRETTRYVGLADLLTAKKTVDPDMARMIATNTRVPNAGAVVGRLDAAGAKGKLFDALLRWDGRADLDSVGTAAFVYWATQNPAVSQLVMKDALKLHAARLAAPAWTAEEQKAAVDALAPAESALIRDFGRLDVKWGEVMRMRRGAREIGVSGFGFPGLPTAVNPTSGPVARGPLTKKIIANRGSSWRMVVSLEPGHVRSWSVLPYGNSHDSASPFYANQMSLFATRRYKDTKFGELPKDAHPITLSR
ncbi:MAG TPA: penicillin acylase family protein [Fimbriimonas sp.]|nr:penicillin acylase family protein [Fimbriimonas sp.]